ncbi:MAG: T9SS type A sorting domain-containing protein [Chloroherpetonaceae bacterium]|nr:T9SS type A sorting domain-containing protein [Chloroherpetonaceae bacterium]
MMKKNIVQNLAMLVLALMVSSVAYAQPRAALNGNITSGLRTLSADTVYEVTGFVNVFPGATLRIPAGTKLVGLTGSRPSLQTLRSNDTTNTTNPTLGGILVVEGTANAPVVFTSSAADSAGGKGARGQIGGVILNGIAKNNVPGGTRFGEGGTGPGGGQFDTDSSGSLRYMRVEYGGTVISQGNEVNGFTFNGAGSRTKLEFLQAHFIADDAFEWFGGTADAKYLIATGCDDDQIDTEFGYRGRIQFVVVVQDKNLANRGYESNNDGSGTSAKPHNKYAAWNVTMIGAGIRQANNEINDGIYVRANTGGLHRNHIIANFGAAGIVVDGDAARDNLYAPASADSALAITNSMFFVKNRTSTTDSTTDNGVKAIYAIRSANRTTGDGDTTGLFPIYAASSGNVNANPQFVSVNYNDPLNGVRPNLRPQNPATLNGATPPNDGFFDVGATFMGALPPSIPTGFSTQSTVGDWTATWSNFARQTTALSVGGRAEAVNPVQSFELSQNYPNPFNPSTTINYRLAKAGLVSLKVYDVLGRQVASLVNGRQGVGTYSVQFNASNLSSGVYFYRLQVGEFSESRKMNLVK